VVRAPGGRGSVSGPGTTPTAAGATVAGTLAGTTSIGVRVASGDRVGLDLTVQPWLDPRTLEPPAPATTWRAWADAAPGPGAVRSATTAAVTAAATAARAAEYSPYLQADTPGRAVSAFRYSVAVETTARRADDHLDPDPAAIAAAVVALLAIVGNAALLRRLL
jgi:hypothetical protein